MDADFFTLRIDSRSNAKATYAVKGNRKQLEDERKIIAESNNNPK